MRVMRQPQVHQHHAWRPGTWPTPAPYLLQPVLQNLLANLRSRFGKEGLRVFRTLVANGQMEQKYLAARAMLEPKASPCHAALRGLSCWCWRGRTAQACGSLLTRPSCAARGDLRLRRNDGLLPCPAGLTGPCRWAQIGAHASPASARSLAPSSAQCCLTTC